ncbi:hypothetical protein W04_0184 [Pseudoalteromonas sp. SW0106-04]|uniref:Tse2 family ADP-ribosyltransferase toxin n=1 Tax=Pseudoalteromonas sp. SW0106-04 TaxID=1702169 RepID=UPI0006B529E4|nr:hypothetical protein [Pseudoalteromonas sp. SW0106-04]GAP73673.1 hypothetical protein W04_0184 [Pseudoalteromonas sp. SW0106-04]
MITPESLYIMDVAEFTKDLYRMGNATWPKFDEDRARVDVVITKQDGIEMVVANGNGFSAFDHLTRIMKKPGKKVWKIVKGASLPKELKIVKDMRPGHEGHYMIAPAKNMTLKKYLGILEELGLDRSRVKLVTKEELANAS